MCGCGLWVADCSKRVFGDEMGMNGADVCDEGIGIIGGDEEFLIGGLDENVIFELGATPVYPTDIFCVSRIPE